jgi:MtN3 and saliva related transmembrane protein
MTVLPFRPRWHLTPPGTIGHLTQTLRLACYLSLILSFLLSTLYFPRIPMTITLETIIGLAAAALTTSAFIPQAVKTFRQRRTKDISVWMYVILVSGLTLWLIYGLLRSDLPVIVANAVTLVFVIAILFMKLRFG